ncbi:MAG: sugar transferase [Pseudomonadales bacterium]|nr:sugar transferase [Pseudomonadales bacterium]MBO7004786.1 sugar transferase [Pseudomonadales bacterium]
MLKRISEIFLSSIALIALLPFFVCIAIAIKLDTSGPVFFKQVRVGLNREYFSIFKFRTMIQDADKQGLLISRSLDSRITKIGGFLRRYKLDELPQLINILLGQMSFVGPRPEVPKYVEMLPELFDITLSVKPGLTDYASVEFIQEASMLETSLDAERTYIDEILPCKLRLSESYVRDQCFFVDLKVIAKTLGKIVKG